MRCGSRGATSGNTRIVSSECCVGCGQRVALPHEEEHAVLGDRFDREPRRVPLGAGRVGHRELEPAGEDFVRQVLEIAGLRMHAQARIGRGHAAERRAQREFGGEHVGAEMQLGRLQAGEFLEVAGEVARLAEDARGVVDHQAPGLAGLQRAGGACRPAGC